MLAVFAASASAQPALNEFAIKRFASEGWITTDDLDNDDTNAIEWKISATTYFNEDEGTQYVRLKHDLKPENGIKPTDIVEFEVGFTTESSVIIDPVNIAARDVVKCTMLRNAQDTRFWSQVATDGYYACVDSICTDGATTTFNEDASPSDVDWFIPEVDDDYKNPFCTPHSTNSAVYACERIQCQMDRKIDTGFNDDFAFTFADATSTDKLKVAIGEAKYGVNPTDETGTQASTDPAAEYITNVVAIELTVNQNAIALACTSLLSSALIATMALF